MTDLDRRTGRTGILLLNLGTPEAPTKEALRRYLAEFLGDPRVVEIPRILWMPILHGVILTTRPKASAAKYAQIWTPEGSPLLVNTERQAQRLAERLHSRYPDLEVRYAMRYGNPSTPGVLEEMRAAGVTRILAWPLYPQFAVSSTGTALAKVFDSVSVRRDQPSLRTVRSYHDNPAYIGALAAQVQAYWSAHGRGERLIMSFHGIPKRSTALGEPYEAECRRTGALLAEALGLGEEEFLVCFQSRFGRAEWLQPYFAPTVAALPGQGIRRVDVVCPGFASDCLETLEEINMEGRAAFLTAGGQEYHYIPALNDAPAWIDALAAMCERELAGWLPDARSVAPPSDAPFGTAAGFVVD